MNRIEVGFAQLKKGDTVVRTSRSGQTPSVVEEVFTLKIGEKAFRTAEHDNPGVYYTERNFVFAYREAKQEVLRAQMKNLTIYVGKNVNSLKFTQGGRVKGLRNGEVFIHMTDDTFRDCPYGDQHDSSFCEMMVHDLSYTLPSWNMHVSTHKACLMNLVGDLIDNGILKHDSVKIILLDEDNNKVSECGYTEDGYLSQGWRAGFMDSTGDEWMKFK